jgi:hypothetical protein
MKIKIPILVLIALAGCRAPQDLPGKSSANSMEWECGHNAESVGQVLEVGRGGKLNLELTTNSLCTNSGIRVLVETAGKAIFADTARAFPYRHTLPVPKQAKVAVSTSVVQINKNNCAWLGVVKCRASW